MKDIEELLQRLARLPGLGARSAQRIALHLLKKKDSELAPLQLLLARVLETVRNCSRCGALTTEEDPCSICRSTKREVHILCVVEDMADLWALERARCFGGKYHILGGVLSALDGVGPEDLRIDTLITRCQEERIQEVILALSATLEGQTTIHYIKTHLDSLNIRISTLARGMPMGGELDYLDEGTLLTAFNARLPAI